MAKLTLIMLAAPLAAAGAIVPAAAQEEDRQSISVRYGDLDLASPDGREELTDRVRVAARRACAAPHNPVLPARIATLRCERLAARTAETQLAALLKGNGSQLADHGRRPVVAAP